MVAAKGATSAQALEQTSAAYWASPFFLYASKAALIGIPGLRSAQLRWSHL